MLRPVPTAERTTWMPSPQFRPSEYTAALIQVLQATAHYARGVEALEMGCGSGVVLATVGRLGAAKLCGVDVEEEAVQSGASLLHDMGLGQPAEFHRGSMWLPVAGRRFGLIVANLPHFPTQADDMPGRLPTWSAGGEDGRGLLDPFLEGLGAHLAPGGHAVITHNAFLGIERSREIVARFGLSLRVALSTLVYIPDDKVVRMTPRILRAEEGRTIHRFGPYTFGELDIVDIGPPGNDS